MTTLSTISSFSLTSYPEGTLLFKTDVTIEGGLIPPKIISQGLVSGMNHLTINSGGLLSLSGTGRSIGQVYS